MAITPIRSGDAPANPKNIATVMAEHIDYRGLRPFHEANSINAGDRTEPVLNRATCLLSLLAAAFEDSQRLVGSSDESSLDMLNSKTIAGALEGIETLVQLGVFFLNHGPEARP